MKVHDHAATLGGSVDGMDVTVQAVCCVFHLFQIPSLPLRLLTSKTKTCDTLFDVR